MNIILIFAFVAIPSGICYLHYRLFTRNRIVNLMAEKGEMLRNKEILDEVIQYFRFVKRQDKKTRIESKVLTIAIIEVSIMIIVNISWIIFLLLLFLA